MKNPLLDIDFLKKLDNQTHHEIFAKIIALDFNEYPVEEITGKVTQGSVNIDGTSAIRRSCSVTMVAKDVDFHEFYWGLETKIELYIGLENNINSEYDDIIWFKQGVFLLTSFNTSYNINSYTISLSGKDKMSLLNGDIGGNITSLSVDFGTYDEIDSDGNVINYDYPIKEIITEAVHHYAQEPYHNIVVSDLDDQGFELMEYRGDVDLFLLISENSTDVTNIRFNDEFIKDAKYYIVDTGEPITLDMIPESQYDKRMTLTEQYIEPLRIKAADSDEIYTVAKISYGETCGYRLTELIYAGDLIGAVDNSITSAVLDKIVTMLGDYEYFYDVDGVFHFQRKKTYINKSWNNIINSRDEVYADSAAYTSAVSYSFTDNNLITAFQNTPDLKNLRNDYAIWGKRSTASGADVPIHLRYAIDNKARYYKTFDGTVYLTEDEFISIRQQELEVLSNSNASMAADNINAFKTTSLPTGLSNDWWEIDDWARRYLYYADVNDNNSISYYKGLSSDELVQIINAATLPTGTEKDFNYYCYQLKILTLSQFVSSWGTADWLTIFPKPTEINNVYYSELRQAKEEKKVVWYGLFDTALSASGEEYIKSVVHGRVITNNDNSIPTTSLQCSHTFSYALAEKSQGVTNQYHTYIYDPSFPKEIKDELTNSKDEQEKNSIINQKYKIVDWREIIYQMALDYFKYQHDDDFLSIIAENNEEYYPLGVTGYEQYYTDMQGFWRQLYNIDIEPINLSTFDVNRSNHYYLWDNEAKTFTDYTFKDATDILPVEQDIEYYYFNGTKVLSTLIAEVQSYADAIKSATSQLDKELRTLTNPDDIKKVTEYYSNIIIDNQYKLNESNENYTRQQFLDIINEDGEYDYELAKKLVAAFYPNYYQISETKWQNYELYHNYRDDESYYKYDFVKDLTMLSTKDTYYIKDDNAIDGYVEYNKTDYVDDITGELDVLGNYPKKVVPSFSFGNKYYTYEGFEKVASLAVGDNTYYTYSSYKPVYDYTDNTVYYSRKVFHSDEHSTEYVFEKIKNITKENFSNFKNNCFILASSETLKSTSGAVKGYRKILELKANIKYESRKMVNGILVIETPKYFERGTTYYYPDGSFAFTFEKGIVYYLYKGYTEKLDLSMIDTNGYYVNYSNGEIAKEAFNTEQIYYGYIKQKNENVTNGKYYIKQDDNTFIEKNILRNFVRGKIYYIYGDGYDLVNIYNDYDPNQVYYIYENDEYKTIDSVISKYLNPTTKLLTKIQMGALANNYGIKVYDDGTIYGLGQNYNFYIKKDAYREVNYYTFGFYKKAIEYNPDEKYFILNGSEYIEQSNIDILTFKNSKKQYYTKLDLNNLLIYLTDQYNVSTSIIENKVAKDDSYGWTMDLENPEMLNFWFDFLDLDDGELAQYSVSAIGDRPKAVNDDAIKAIYYRDTPTVIFCGSDGNYIKTFINSETFAAKDNNGEKRVYYEKDNSGNYKIATSYSSNKDYYRLMTVMDKQPGYTYINLTDTVDNLFSISAQGKSAINMLDNFLYNYSYCTESITITALPIYYLEPNTRIFVHDDNSGIDGEFLVTRISLPLQYNGTMSITATKAVDRII